MQTEDPFRYIVDSIGVAVFIYQGNQNVYANKASEELTGYTVGELTEMNFWDIIDPEWQEKVRQRGLLRQKNEVVPSRYELKIIHKKGVSKWIEYAARSIDYAGNTAVLGIAYDITEKKKEEIERETLRNISSRLLEKKELPDMFREIESLLKNSFGFDEVVIQFPERPEPVFSEGREHLELDLKTEEIKFGRLVIYGQRNTPLTSPGQETLQIIANSLSQAIKRRSVESRMEEMAFKDLLTGLSNRAFVKERFENAFQNCANGNRSAALLFIDLDSFKEINDSLGHTIGDELLRRIARKLESHSMPGCVLGRHGGDEFVMIIPDADNLTAVEKLASGIVSTLADPIRIDDMEFKIGGSVGISIFPDHGSHLGDLIRMADSAMYSVKKNGGGGYAFHRPS